jgi:hypothetical protein
MLTPPVGSFGIVGSGLAPGDTTRLDGGDVFEDVALIRRAD